MPRLDLRIRTKLPAKLSYNKEGTYIVENTIISELSLSGALIDTSYLEPEDTIILKPRLHGNNGIYLTGRIIRRFTGKIAAEFHFSDRYTKKKLWESIREQISTTNECPYCCHKNNSVAEYCENCKWLLNFNDKAYLDKHDAETCVARLKSRSGVLNIEQMQRVINFMDTELLSYADSKDTNRFHNLEENIHGNFCSESIVSQHPGMLQIIRLIAQVADSDANILIQGESGTGKELVASALHYNSRRKNKPFVAINCSAIPESLLESELFGHVRGAFTGAIDNKVGLFESADSGTIFLDEVSEMIPSMQVKLLRILQIGEYSQVGSAEIRQCNVRILAATNKDLLKLTKEGEFREDLYYRLNVLDILLPPLRDRKCDIPILVQHFLKIFSTKYGKENLQMSRNAEVLLLAYDFPGNIRELENIIQRAVVLAESESIEVHHLPATLQMKEAAFMDNNEKHSTFKAAKQQVVERFECEYVIDCLKAARGNISRASQAAGINVKNFHDKMKKYEIDPYYFKESTNKIGVCLPKHW